MDRSLPKLLGALLWACLVASPACVATPARGPSAAPDARPVRLCELAEARWMEEGGSWSAPGGDHVASTVSVEGGVIGSPDGLLISVPPGGATRPTEFSIARTEPINLHIDPEDYYRPTGLVFRLDRQPMGALARHPTLCVRAAGLPGASEADLVVLMTPMWVAADFRGRQLRVGRIIEPVAMEGGFARFNRAECPYRGGPCGSPAPGEDFEIMLIRAMVIEVR